jgi:acyl carrier protein
MTDLETRVRDCLAVLHDMTGVADHADLLDALALDSLDVVEIEAELGFALGVEIDLVEAFKDGPVSVHGLAALLASKLEEA